MGQHSRYGEELDGPGLESPTGARYFLLQNRLDLLWAPPSPLFSG
jgi:hypothetical protein